MEARDGNSGWKTSPQLIIDPPVRPPEEFSSVGMPPQMYSSCKKWSADVHLGVEVPNSRQQV